MSDKQQAGRTRAADAPSPQDYSIAIRLSRACPERGPLRVRVPGVRVGLQLIVMAAVCLLHLASSTHVVEAQGELPTPEATAPARGEPVQETLEAQVISADPPRPCANSTADPLSAPEPAPGTTPEPERCQRVELVVTAGKYRGQKILVQEGRIPVASRSTATYNVGDRVLVDYLHGGGQPDAFFITDFIRTSQLFVLALVFVGLAIAFGGWRGFTSLIGLGVSFAVLLFFMLPRIIAGDDPVVISIIGGLGIMLVTLYLSHGFNRKTTAALCGTAISLVVTGVLSWVAVDLVKLSGFGSDEATFVQITQGGAINLRGLLLGGMIIGALGVLDDVTIGQSAAVFELHNVEPALPWQRLFRHAMNIGKDHIAATVNTLVLAYAGASLPLLILFVAGPDPWDRIVNQEIVAEEIVRTLVGSIGLIASVPVTTWLASLLAVRSPAQPVEPGGHAAHAHHH
jgi:uncharacterized membrane protein